MGSLTDISDAINRVTGGNSGTPEHIFWSKLPRVNGAAAAAPVAAKWTSLWRYEGSPCHGTAPSSTGAALDNTTDGGLKQTDPSGGRQKWLLGATAAGSQPMTFLLYDRLAQDGGLSGTTATAQTVSFTPPTRYNDGVGNQIWVEISTAVGSTARTITASYTNQAGTSGQTTQAVAFGGTGDNNAERMIPLSLATGDTGVRNVASVTLSASTGTAGDFAVVLIHPIALIHSTGGGLAGVRDFVTGLPSVPEIKTDACLALVGYCNTTTAISAFGSVHMVEA